MILLYVECSSWYMTRTLWALLAKACLELTDPLLWAAVTLCELRLREVVYSLCVVVGDLAVRTRVVLLTRVNLVMERIF